MDFYSSQDLLKIIVTILLLLLHYCHFWYNCPCCKKTVCFLKVKALFHLIFISVLYSVCYLVRMQYLFKRYMLSFLERETMMQEGNIHGLLPSCPVPGIKPTTQACDLTWSQTGDDLVQRTRPNQLNHTGHGSITFLELNCKIPSCI